MERSFSSPTTRRRIGQLIFVRIVRGVGYQQVAWSVGATSSVPGFAGAVRDCPVLARHQATSVPGFREERGRCGR
jgi:hypothetical protein